MTPSATMPSVRPRRSEAAITVAGSGRTAQWLAQAGRPWQIRRLEDGGVPQGLLVLAQPGDFPAQLHHWIAAHRVVVSLDCPKGRSLALSDRLQTFTFSEGRDAADLTAKDVHMTPSGQLRFMAVTRSALTRVTLDDPDDLYPALAALACGAWLGAPLEQMGQIVSAPQAQRRGKVVRMA